MTYFGGSDTAMLHRIESLGKVEGLSRWGEPDFAVECRCGWKEKAYSVETCTARWERHYNAAEMAATPYGKEK